MPEHSPPQLPPKTTMQIICVLSYGVVSKIYLFFFFFFFFGLFAFSRAAPMAHGGSQDRGLIGAVDAGLCHSHSNAGSEQCLQPTPQLTAMWILNPTWILNKARDQTCVLIDTSQIRFL